MADTVKPEDIGKERKAANDPPIARRPNLVQKSDAKDFNDYYKGKDLINGRTPNSWQPIKNGNSNIPIDAVALKEGIQAVGNSRNQASAKGAEQALDRVKTSRGLMDSNQLKNMGDAISNSEGASEVKPSIMIDGEGNASFLGPKGVKTEVPGNFSKLHDIFNELVGKAKGAGKAVVDKVDSALTRIPKLPDSVGALEPDVNAGGAESANLMRQGILKKGAGMAAEQAGKMGASRALAVAGGPLTAGTMAFLAAMAPSEANAGEDQLMAKRNAEFDGGQLDNQTQNVVADPGINPDAKPTRTVDAGPDPRPDTNIGQSMPQAATMTDNVTNGGATGTSQKFDRQGSPVGGVQTKGGYYPTFDKSSGEAADFRTAFARAHSSGMSTFNWQGREYSTAVKS